MGKTFLKKMGQKNSKHSFFYCLYQLGWPRTSRGQDARFLVWDLVEVGKTKPGKAQSYSYTSSICRVRVFLRSAKCRIKNYPWTKKAITNAKITRDSIRAIPIKNGVCMFPAAPGFLLIPSKIDEATFP